MAFNTFFFINSVLLGVALSMDAFSISIANTLHEPNMRKFKMIFAAFIYAFFQFAMPMLGWICVHTISNIFSAFQKFIPWIALILLLYIGIKMIVESLKTNTESKNHQNGKLTFSALIIQGIALSVGFTIADFTLFFAFIASLIIALVTFIICMIGLLLGKSIGQKLSKADIFGGIILIGIGIEIFVKGVFFK